MNLSFLELKYIYNKNLQNINFSNPVMKWTKNYLSNKMPFATTRNLGKAMVLSKAYGVKDVSKSIASIVSKDPKIKLAVNMLLTNKYDELRNKILADGRNKGLKGAKLRSYVRKILRSRDLKRFR